MSYLRLRNALNSNEKNEIITKPIKAKAKLAQSSSIVCGVLVCRLSGVLNTKSILRKFLKRGNLYIKKNDENVLRLMLRNASEHKWMKFSTARFHVSSEIVFKFLNTASANLFESFFIAK